MHRHPISEILVLVGVLALVAIGCEKPPGPFVPRSATAPGVTYCNDHTGHKPGNKPFVMGGTCCCTPTEALMAKLHADGFCTGMTAENLREAYGEAGPHVVLGGKCMCPPTPGTEYAELVIHGAPSPTTTPTPPK